MRVIAGKAGSLPLRTIEGDGTRPTTDRIKETLFNILGPSLADCRFLDIFSGSGAIGIEALSRGAAEAVFVEKNKRACTCIRQNLSFTKLADNGKILCMDALQALRVLEGGPAFDIIFMDPPYGKGLYHPLLEQLAVSTLVRADTLIVIEEAVSADFRPVSELGYELIRSKKYKTNQHVFLRRMQNKP
ncbi:MAG: 16S rRNA (guanine(966)-N(2))-methyltransferase RsmD [Blautia sp.]|nr:16S rRNA (guanine(966)-N(2))-methyltransferase RsmD [Blautia sp.]